MAGRAAIRRSRVDYRSSVPFRRGGRAGHGSGGESGLARGPARGLARLRGRGSLCVSVGSLNRGSVGCGAVVANASTGVQQPTQNWHGPGESDCLIKTEHCDVRKPGVDAM